MKPLFEQYRPASWADVVGQDKAISRFRAIAKRGIGGRSFWITGQSGTGKTTIGRLIAAEIADDHWVNEIDATALTVAELRNIDQTSALLRSGHRRPPLLVLAPTPGVAHEGPVRLRLAHRRDLLPRVHGPRRR